MIKTFKYTFILFCVLILNNLCSGQKWPVPIYFPEYSRYITLSDEVNLNDTIIINHSQTIFFKFVFFDAKGKSYCEVYKNKKLYEKGFYENSLDTLKRYSSSVKGGRRRGRIFILKYFEPVKHGKWIETEKGKLKKKVYDMGEGIY